MSMTEERAEEYAKRKSGCQPWQYASSAYRSYKQIYIDVATEQKEIDINTAMWAFWEVVSPYFPDKDIAEEVSDRFRKTMERQR